MRLPLVPSSIVAAGLSAAALVAVHPAVVAGGEAITRFRYDGTGMFRDARPVVDWDERTGSNIVWKTRR